MNAKWRAPLHYKDDVAALEMMVRHHLGGTRYHLGEMLEVIDRIFEYLEDSGDDMRLKQWRFSWYSTRALRIFAEPTLGPESPAVAAYFKALSPDFEHFPEASVVALEVIHDLISLSSDDC